jgi:hypothetical protein
MSETGNGIDRYAETACDFLDASLEDYWRRIEYADPDAVHPSALKDNASRREQGYWLKPETLPRKMLWANGAQPLPEVLPGFLVSPRFRALVEQFEPGVHQFVPIEIYKSRKGEPVATYFWFIVGQRLDSVDREHTTYIWKAPQDDPEAGYWTRRIRNHEAKRYEEIPGAKLIFNEAKVTGHHIWHDPHLLTFGNGLCSDAFAHEAATAGFLGLGLSPRETV